jgi:hypothetical protein
MEAPLVTAPRPPASTTTNATTNSTGNTTTSGIGEGEEEYKHNLLQVQLQLITQCRCKHKLIHHTEDNNNNQVQHRLFGMCKNNYADSRSTRCNLVSTVHECLQVIR